MNRTFIFLRSGIYQNFSKRHQIDGFLIAKEYHSSVNIRFEVEAESVTILRKNFTHMS